ncbi:MAG: membrane protein insertion efficiency factor YidD [Polyangiaceae bacterium]|nr:membrane protein insertion efficiency factor YidD [Polyangiaceae bacterium]
MGGRGARNEVLRNRVNEPARALAPGNVCPQACQSSGAAAAHDMLAKLLLVLIRMYQLTLSKLILATIGPVCRFEPSCSRYAAACIAGQGALRGSLLSVKRLCKCHPFHPGGYDPPPPPRFGRSTAATTPAADDAGEHERHRRSHSPNHAGVLPSG